MFNHRGFLNSMLMLMIGLLVLSTPVWAESVPELTLSKAIELGLERNTELKNSRSTLEKAGYEFDEARSHLKPDLSLDGSYTRMEEGPREFDISEEGGIPSISYSEGSRDQYSAGLTLQQPLHQDLFTEINLAENRVELAKKQYRQSKQQVINKIIESYYNVLKAANNVEIQEESLKIAREHERVAKSRYDAGTVLKTDVLKSTIEKQNVQKSLNSTRKQLKTAKKELAIMIGVDQEQSFAVSDPGYEPDLELDLEQLYQQALENSYQLMINQLNIELTEDNKEIEDSLREPTLNVSGDYRTEGSSLDLSEGSWSITASVSIDLYDGGVNQARQRQIDEDIKQLKNTRSNIKEEIKLNINSLINTLEDLKETIRIEEMSVENAEENLRIANKTYKSGTGTSLDVIDAQTSYRRSQINLSESEYQYKINLFNMLASTGQLTDYYEEVIDSVF